MKHIYENSRRLIASPWALLGGAFIRAADSVPWWVNYHSYAGKASLNFYAMFIGDSGAGKTLLQRNLDDILCFIDGAGKTKRFPTIEVGSGEAIPDAFAAEVDKITGYPIKWTSDLHNLIVSFDEVGRLRGMQSRQGGTTVLEFLKPAWSGAQFGRRKADRNGVLVPAYEYRLTAFINAQPERCGVILSEDEVQGGFPQRLLWLNTQDASVVDEVDYTPVTKFQVPVIDWKSVGEIRALPVMDEAHRKDRINFHSGNRDLATGHDLLLRAKVAVLFAVLDGRPALNEEDWKLSEFVMEHSAGVRNMARSRMKTRASKENKERGIERGIQNSVSQAYTRCSNMTLMKVNAAKQAGIKPTKGKIKNEITKSLREHFDAVWAELAESGEVDA